jgi:glycosyltransferase involved in cell wall biosynthesis
MSGPRVAYIILWFPKPTETFILDEVNTLARLGLEVEVHTLYGPYNPYRVAGMAAATAPVSRLGLASLKVLLNDLAHLGRHSGPGEGRFLAGVLLRRWLSLERAGEACWAVLAGVHLARKFRERGLDQIHAPWADGPATAAWVASRLSGIPFSFCARANEIHPPDGALKEKLAAARWVRTENLANRRYLAEFFPPAAGKLVNIYPGAPLSAPRPGLSPPEAPPYRLLALGRFVSYKGFAHLITACRQLMEGGLDYRLTLAGEGPQGFKLWRLVKNYHLEDRVALPGFVPHRQVPALLQQAHLLIMPSVIAPSGARDGIPTVILEALLHEVPVVATAVGGIPEVIQAGVTGWLVPPGDPKALGQAILEALEDPAEARRRARAGRELVEREFDSQKNYGRLKECFERLI